MNLSRGERPVRLPVRATNAPFAARTPSPLLSACFDQRRDRKITVHGGMFDHRFCSPAQQRPLYFTKGDRWIGVCYCYLRRYTVATYVNPLR